LDDVINEIKKTIIMPFVYKEVYAKFPAWHPIKGALFYGPPGCGKTMLGKAIAYEMAELKKQKGDKDASGYFMYLAGPEFLQELVGAGERKVREVFGAARETSGEKGDPVVVFIDEPESVFKQRGTGISTDANDSITNQFLAEIDGMKPLDNVIILLATNRPELLDSAVIRPGRIDRKIKIPRPNQKSAEDIFKIYLKGMPLKPIGKGKQEELYAAFAAKEIYEKPRPLMEIKYADGTKGIVHYKDIFSGASVVSIIRRATGAVIEREIATGKNEELTKEDLVMAIEAEFNENKGLSNLVTKDDLKRITGENYSNKQIIGVVPLYS